MKKLPMILLALLAAACIVALPFLCTHSDILPEVSTAYYEQKAQKEALTATGPEAELMRMLLGLSADTEVEPVRTPIRFSWFGLYLAIGTFIAICALLSNKQHDLRSALLWTSALAVPFGLIGARLVYALVNIPFYLNAISAPEAMLKVWEGGLSLTGALAFIVLAGVIGAKLGNARIAEVLDALASPLLVLAGFFCIGIGQSDIGFGPEIGSSFLAVTINGAYRLNTPLLVALVLLIITIAAATLSKNAPAGHYFALTAFLYGSVMILMESLREDGHMVWGFVHAEMVFDLCFALPALLYLAKTKKRVLLSLLSTAVLAGAVVALEFALDRSAIGDGLLYLVYAAVLAGYLALGCCFARKRPFPSESCG